MPFVARKEETLRLAEVLEDDYATAEGAARVALRYAWGLIFMRHMYVTVAPGGGLIGPYASEKDALKVGPAVHLMSGPGTYLQERAGASFWIDHCRKCGHRASDHHHTGRSNGHCLHASCECMELVKIEATGKKAQGTNWVPTYTWAPQDHEVEAIKEVMLQDFSTSENMAKAVLKQAFELMQSRNAHLVITHGATGPWFGPYSPSPKVNDQPFLTITIRALKPVHTPTMPW